MSNAVLKNIAYLTMLIDHFFAIVFLEVAGEYAAAGYDTDVLAGIYSAGRAVGRIAFVLFAFLAVEGFLHTKSRGKYLFRLGIFAFVSEIPFDLAFSQQAIDWGSQNVYFTLFLGVLLLAVWEWITERMHRLRQKREGRSLFWYARTGLLGIAGAGAVVILSVAAYRMHTDYRYMGVLLIFAFYVIRGRNRFLQVLVAAGVMFLGTWSANCLRYVIGEAYGYTAMEMFYFSLREMYGLIAFVPIFLYNGKIGRQMPKAVCYGFYPVHLLILHGIMGIWLGMW